MKKPSTTMVRRIGKLQDRQLMTGLDLGDRSSFYSVFNQEVVILEGRGWHQSGNHEKDLREANLNYISRGREPAASECV
jgi:hypothetical protein